MKNVLKSKFMLVFISLMIGVSYLNSLQLKTYNQTSNQELVINETK